MVIRSEPLLENVITASLEGFLALMLKSPPVVFIISAKSPPDPSPFESPSRINLAPPASVDPIKRSC